MHIVIIDDNPVNVALCKAMVKSVTATPPALFTDSAAALQWCTANLPDLVLVDYMMPPPNGLEFVAALRRVPGRENVPVIMITANHDREIRYEALHVGASDFLTKPIDKVEFQARVRNLLALRQSQKELIERAESLDRDVARATRDLRANERLLARQKEWLEVTLYSIADAVLVSDPAGVIEYVNPAAADLLGRPREQITGQPVAQLLRLAHEKTREPIEDPFAACLRQRAVIWHHDPVLLQRLTGSEVIIETKISPICLGSGELAGAVMIFHDVTERSRLFREREHMAFHDPLTDLPNRTLLLRHLTRAASQARRSGGKIALLFLDLDEFKPVNDQLGHGAGDELLVGVARRLQGSLRTGDIVARVGGDEFVVLLEGVPERSHAVMVAKKIIAAMQQPFTLTAGTATIGLSLGIALLPDDTIDEQLLIQLADSAMYAAKQSGKNSYCFADTLGAATPPPAGDPGRPT